MPQRGRHGRDRTERRDRLGPARIDGTVKVTGQATYGADHPVENPAFAFLATAAVARGRIRGIDKAGLAGLPILAVLTHETVGLLGSEFLA